MMRKTAMIGLVVACACTGEAEQPKAAAPKATALQAGQWETTAEVTRLTQQDKGAPRINTPAGTKTTESICIAPAEAKKPNPKLFAGEKNECSYGNFYMSGGTLNATLQCTRPGLEGQLLVTVYGDYEADSFETTLDLSTHLATDGDVNLTSKVTGRRTGECTAPATGAPSARRQSEGPAGAGASG